jgi:flagellin
MDGQALIDTAEGAHKEIENILQRMREVSVQAANDTNNDQDRQNLQAEMNALITEIDRIAGTTTWAGEKLMEAEAGSFFSFQVGAATGTKKPDQRHNRWHGLKHSRFRNSAGNV